MTRCTSTIGHIPQTELLPAAQGKSSLHPAPSSHRYFRGQAALILTSLSLVTCSPFRFVLSFTHWYQSSIQRPAQERKQRGLPVIFLPRMKGIRGRVLEYCTNTAACCYAVSGPGERADRNGAGSSACEKRRGKLLPKPNIQVSVAFYTFSAGCKQVPSVWFFTH